MSKNEIPPLATPQPKKKPRGGKRSGSEVIRHAVIDMSQSAGVYRMISEKDEVLYIGKAKNLKNRLGNYVSTAAMPIRLQRMVFATHSLEVTLTASEAEALLLEATLIKQFQPRYNILLKDDKSYPYIHISTEHDYPRITKYRGDKRGKGEYYGPFVAVGAVDQTITYLQKAFLIRPCSDNIFKNRKRPCLQYQIKRCSAPCVNYINKEEYAQLVTQMKSALKGYSSEVLDHFEAQMKEASEAMDYERAAEIRDRIRALHSIHAHMQSRGSGVKDADILAMARQDGAACVQVFCYRGGANYGNHSFFPSHTAETEDGEIMEAFIGQYYQRHKPPSEILVSHPLPDTSMLQVALGSLAQHKVQLHQPSRGGKKTLVEEALRNATNALKRHINASLREEALLQGVTELFELEEVPSRIEVYDNSHISGTNAVGGMVVAGVDGLQKNAYRKFNIKNTTLTPGDDYAMMREVLTRRFKRLLAEQEKNENVPVPGLVLIDGGLGQLSASAAVLEELGVQGVHLVAVSKGRDRNAGREWLHQCGKDSIQLPKDSPILHYIQRLRDEAHRFAIGTHRDRRSGAMKKSELDSIPGIGGARKKALLRHFGSARGVGGASLIEIERVAGVNKALAKRIYDHFHSG